MSRYQRNLVTGQFPTVNDQIESNQNYVSVTGINSVPGAIITLADALSGVGTQTVQAKATFGNDLAVDANPGMVGSNVSGDIGDYLATTKLGVPMNTINNRGSFQANVILVILY